VNQNIDTGHLRQVGLRMFDIQLLSLLMKSGGEYPMPETDEAKERLRTSSALTKKLVTIVERYGERPHIRLTDEGRVVVAQLEAMAVQPKIEVVNQ
jgi:hypothetical protein